MFHLIPALMMSWLTRKLSRFHQTTLLMTLILQIFVISVLCNIQEAASFDEHHFHQMTWVCQTFKSLFEARTMTSTLYSSTWEKKMPKHDTQTIGQCGNKWLIHSRKSCKSVLKFIFAKLLKGSKGTFQNFQYQTCPLDQSEKDLHPTG